MPRSVTAHGPAFEGERITRVQLGGLDASAVQTLLRERLGLALTRPTLLQVVGASRQSSSSRSSSGGAPRAHFRARRAAWRPGFAEGARRAKAALLPAGTLDVLGKALAGDCGIDMLARALDADLSELLRPAIDADVIEVTDNRVRFTLHPLLASVSHAGTNDTSRRDAHRRLAAAVADPSSARGTSPSPQTAPTRASPKTWIRHRDASRRGAWLPPQSSPDSLRSSRRLTVWTNAPIASSPPRAPQARRRRGDTCAPRTAGRHAARKSQACSGAILARLDAAIGRGRELCAQALNEAEGAAGLDAPIRHLLGYVGFVAGWLNRAREQAHAFAVQDVKDADQLTYAHATSLLFLVDFLAGPRRMPRPTRSRSSRQLDAGAAPDAAERRGTPAYVPRPPR